MAQSKTLKLYRDVYWIALPLIFSASLGNVLEVIDLTVASLIDFEISKAISFLERFRFVFGAILIGFTSTLSMYLNRLIPQNDPDRIRSIYSTISLLTYRMGLLFSLTFGAAVVAFAKFGSPTQIYGIGTAINIFLMYASTPYYISLTCTKRTANILKVGVAATIANAIATWFLGKHMNLGTFGIILPTVLANAVSFFVLRRDAQAISFVSTKSAQLCTNLKEILSYAKENTVGSFVICLSELALVLVALKLGEIGVLYGMFFALEKLFNSATHAVSNSAAISFSERLHVSFAAIDLRPFYSLALFNSLAVTGLSIICLKLYQSYLALGPYLPLILGIVFFNSIDYFLRKVVLRPGGDARWTRLVNIYLIALGNLAIAISVWLVKDQSLGSKILFYSLLIQAFASATLVAMRVASRKWYHAV